MGVRGTDHGLRGPLPRAPGRAWPGTGGSAASERRRAPRASCRRAWQSDARSAPDSGQRDLLATGKLRLRGAASGPRARVGRPRLTAPWSCPGFALPAPGPAPSRGSGGGGSQPGLMSKSMPFLGASLCSSPSFSKAERLPRMDFLSLTLRTVRRKPRSRPCEGPRRGGGTRNKRQRGPREPPVRSRPSFPPGRPPPHQFLLPSPPSEGSAPARAALVAVEAGEA